MPKMSLAEAIADIPNQKPPRAIFCSPVVGEALAKECKLAEASADALTVSLGMRIYFDPEMSPNDFDVGYDDAEIGTRVQLIRARELVASSRNQ